ncbi:MAG: type VI secretion system Vgr family protein [Gemmataceae bacterium]
MGKYTQANRSISIHTPLGEDVLLLEKIKGEEAVSRLFRFELDLWAEQPVPFDKLLGQAATLKISFPNGSGRQVNGILTEVTKGGRLGELLRYRAVLSPAAWLLTHRVQSRIFQHQTVPEILQTVCRDDWQLSVISHLTATYPKRNYCVQYRESDWDFVNRLMEEEGITYYFEHDDKGHQLVLADHALAYPELSQFASVAFDDAQGGDRVAPTIREWEQTQELGSYRYTLRDYTFEKPEDKLTAERNASGDVEAGAVPHPLSLQRKINSVEMLEVYDYPGEFAHDHEEITKEGKVNPQGLEKLQDDLERRSRIRQEAESTAQLRMRGQGDCGHFLPGRLFQLTRHFDGAPTPGEADRYVLTRVELTAAIEGAYTTQGGERREFATRFECLPAKWPLRPARRTPQPHIEGPQTATVVGPAGNEVFVDKFGRIKVRFHWDRQDHQGADCSCWIRVAQFWAGKGWGAFFWPRVGHEVVVAFEDGDPDRPLVVGSVYNAVNMPPLELPDYVTITGVKSLIYGGSPGTNFNSIFIYDTPGKEFVHLHSEKNERQHSENHKLHYVAGMQFSINGDY